MNKPSFYYEKMLWKKGFAIIGGVDEVGRGCFAGPVIAGCVVYKNNTTMKHINNLEIKINDSKKLTPRQRDLADEWIKENSLAWGIGEASVAEINRGGMGKATLSAFRRAVGISQKRLHQRIQYLLIDAFYIPNIRGIPIVRKDRFRDRKRPKVKDGKGRQLAIIHGDERSITIASASIIAKVYRDKLMESLSNKSKYKKYLWGKNKGYGTLEHLKAIKKYGITKFHRKQFVDTYLSKSNTN